MRHDITYRYDGYDGENRDSRPDGAERRTDTRPAFYRRQIALLEAANIEGLMGQYQPDATLLNYDTCVTGTANLREFFVGYLAALGSIRLKSTDRFAESPDSILFEATVETAHGTARVYDVFTLKDGRATHHYAGVISFTPKN